MKPRREAGPEAVEGFAQSCDLVAREAARVENLRTSGRYSHPWFGALDAAGWHFLAGTHMRLHRPQIERILQVAGGARAV